MRVNSQWHADHRRPPNATFEERARWHFEHRDSCGCRPIPVRLAEQMRERGMLEA
jgi:hypothetical protein